jgi:hypothetical protein
MSVLVFPEGWVPPVGFSHILATVLSFFPSNDGASRLYLQWRHFGFSWSDGFPMHVIETASLCFPSYTEVSICSHFSAMMIRFSTCGTWGTDEQQSVLLYIVFFYILWFE